MAKKFGDDCYGTEEKVQDMAEKPIWGGGIEIGDIGIGGRNEDDDLDTEEHTDSEEGGSKGKRKTRKGSEKEKREK